MTTFFSRLTCIVLCVCLPLLQAQRAIPAESTNWGYGYSDLVDQLEEWSASPWVTVDSIGASVQNRGLWEVAITDTMQPVTPRQTIYMHVRTHPNEVQSFWVAYEFINLLLDENDFSAAMRQKCNFYIVPMYNPDGVELGYPRQNANQVDIESNWSANPMEPEPTALKNRFTALMNSDAPIRIALNMHAAYNGNPRYFVYHHENGTSFDYTQLEQEFIGAVRSYFGGIGPWDTFVSWTNGTPSVYPESWFWLNHGEAVLALTYEDWNSESASDYDSSASAILHGIDDYLNAHYNTEIDPVSHLPQDFILYANYPNPFNANTTIDMLLYKESWVSISIYDAQGQWISTLMNGVQQPGRKSVQWDAASIPSGVYFCQVKSQNTVETRKMTLLK